MIGKEDIGKISEPALVKIDPENVRRFAEAVGIPYDHRVPPTYVATLRHGDFPGLELYLPGSIHGEQVISYRRPLREGEKFVYRRTISDVYEKVGKLGKMTLVVIETRGYDPAGEIIFTSRSTVIIPDQQRGGNNETL